RHRAGDRRDRVERLAAGASLHRRESAHGRHARAGDRGVRGPRRVTRVVVGRVGKPHGLDGAFFVEQASDDGRWFATGARLWAGEDEVEVVAARRGAGGGRVVGRERGGARGGERWVAGEAGT